MQWVDRKVRGREALHEGEGPHLVAKDDLPAPPQGVSLSPQVNPLSWSPGSLLG